MATLQRFDQADSLAQALAQRVAALLAGALRERGHVSLVVSGGKTPALFFGYLSKQKLDWKNVWITLADERWVEPTHADSNEKLVRNTLLQNCAHVANFIGLKHAAATPQQGAAELETALKVIPQPFDVVVLGMGDDGHTASWFPQAPQLAAALDMNNGHLCMGIDPVTAAHPRMTLTRTALLNSRAIALQISGANKLKVYEQAVAVGPVEALPIRAVLQQAKVPVDVFWNA